MAYYSQPPKDPEYDVLPTYEAATTRDPIALVASYIRREDVLSACLVSKAWRAALIPTLWGEPHRYWGMGERNELTSFLLFLHTLSNLKEPVHHTKILSLVNVRPTIYTTLPPDWLRTILTKLPEIRQMIISDFQFFDNTTLLATSSLESHQLQHLSVRYCKNSTTAGLCALLRRLPSLISLDLYGTSGASHPSTLAAISTLNFLNTLSLSDLKLTDAAIIPLFKSLGLRLRSLDLRSNLLGEPTASTLLDWNVAPPSYITADGPRIEQGLTRLRISDNLLTVSDAVSLLKSARLATFDIGRPRGDESALVETLKPTLSMYAHDTLQTLRITHRIVMAPKGLGRGMLPQLRTMVLTEVPEWSMGKDLFGLIVWANTSRKKAKDRLEVLEIEMTKGDGDSELSLLEEEVQQEKPAWAARIHNTVEEVSASRKRQRGMDEFFEGKVRVLWELAGKESVETGVEGERWGRVCEGV